MLVLAPLGQHIGGYAQGLYRRYPLLQGVRVVCDDLNQGVHIVKILAFPVHPLLQVQSGADGVPQFLKILTGITHIPHPGAVDHGCLADGVDRLFPGLFDQVKTQADSLPGFNQGGEPAFAYNGRVAIAADVEIGVAYPVDQQIIGMVRIYVGRRDQIRNGGGSGLQTGERGCLLSGKPFPFLFPGAFRGRRVQRLQCFFIVDAMYHPQHIEYPVRETKMLGGVFIDELVEQFQNKIVRIFRL